MKSARDGLIHIIESGISNLHGNENESRISSRNIPSTTDFFQRSSANC